MGQGRLEDSSVVAFECQCKDVFRSACKELPFYGAHEGKRYCILHLPTENKGDDFKEALKAKLKQGEKLTGTFDFQGTFFPDNTGEFKGFKFDGDVYFFGATFRGGADFSEAKFNGTQTWFQGAKFSGESISFRGAEFSSPRGTRFMRANFGSERTDFSDAEFSGEDTSFERAKFSGRLSNFSGTKFSSTWTTFQRAKLSSKRIVLSGAEFDSRLTNFQTTEFSSAEDTSFRGAKFSGAHTIFRGAEFSGRSTSFLGAEFSSGEDTSFQGAKFTSAEEIIFVEAEFSSGRTDFSESTFSGTANFQSAAFRREVDFSRATFKRNPVFVDTRFTARVHFSGAHFESGGDYRMDSFERGADFSNATFSEGTNFVGVLVPSDFAELGNELGYEPQPQFYGIRIEKPESSSFRSMVLKPSWFVNTDVRKLRFTNVVWVGLPNGPKGSLEEELQDLYTRGFGETDAPHELLSATCRELALNSEESRNYSYASEFNYWALDAQRRQLRRSAFAPWRLIWWYWALSGYGERHIRSAIWLVGILLGFAVLYMLMGFVTVQEISAAGVLQAFWESIVYSFSFMTRQNAVLNAAVTASGSVLLQFLVVFEGVVGLLQLALFGLAVRRKFMR